MALDQLRTTHRPCLGFLHERVNCIFTSEIYIFETEKKRQKKYLAEISSPSQKFVLPCTATSRKKKLKERVAVSGVTVFDNMLLQQIFSLYK